MKRVSGSYFFKQNRQGKQVDYYFKVKIKTSFITLNKYDKLGHVRCLRKSICLLGNA